MEPRQLIQRIEETASLPSGSGERFAGYSVIGLPFRSGRVLELRRFPASNLGPGYASVWHRDPIGNWTFYSTTAPEQSCFRYFGSQVEENVHARVRIEWGGPDKFRVIVDGSRPLSWAVTLTQTVASRLMNAAAGLAPDSRWQKALHASRHGLHREVRVGNGKDELGRSNRSGSSSRAGLSSTGWTSVLPVRCLSKRA